MAKPKTFGENLIEAFREGLDVVKNNKTPAAHSYFEVMPNGQKVLNRFERGVLVARITMVDGKAVRLPLN